MVRTVPHRGKVLFDLLQQGSPKTIRLLLAELERKFNGDVFELPETDSLLTIEDLRRLAELVEARTQGASAICGSSFHFVTSP